MTILSRVKTLFDLLSTPFIFDMDYYRESELSRLMNLFAHVDINQWRGMKILEVGAGIGHIGQVFANLGFDVTSTDGRPEYVEKMKSEGRKSFVLDLDSASVDVVGQYDVILSFGVLYHLTHPEVHLANCRNAKILVLESCVADLNDPVVNNISEGKGLRGKDQALNEFGCRPSPAWVEAKCREAGFSKVTDISNPNANWVSGIFDWKPTNSGKWKTGNVNFRKMWVCEK